MVSQIASSEIKSELTDYFSSVLRVPAHLIRTDIPILELGTDSIMLVEAQRWLKARFGCLIEIPQFFDELNTVDHIAAFVSASQPPVAAGSHGAAETMPQSAPPVRADAPRPSLSALGSRKEYGLMRTQLTLLGEVIEAQNRLLITMQNAQGKLG